MNARTRIFSILAVALATAGTAAAASGAGIVDIDQAKVPFTISAPGSYRLTSDLRESDPNTSVIKITAPGVTIDLNGFSISGGLQGIDAFSVPRITLYNGQVSDSSVSGIGVGPDSRVERVRVLNSGADGIDCNGACEIVHCVVSHNRGIGILMNELGTPFGRGIVSSSLINANGIFGIAVGTGVLVTGNSINGNAFDGLSCRVSTSGYSNNVFDGNGFPASGCVNLGQNACDGAICQ